MLGESKILEILKKAIANAPGDAHEALFIGSEDGLTRYAESSVHQNLLVKDTRTTFRIAAGKRIGVATTNSLEESALTNAVNDAYEAALKQPEIPHFAGFVKPAKVRKIKTFFNSTAKTNPRARARAAKGFFDEAKKAGVRIAGSFATSTAEMAVVNSNEVALYQPMTGASVSIFALSDTSSGYADAFSRDIKKINFDALAERAISKCVAGKDPQTLEPGKYDVILEPTAVSEIMEWLSYIAFGAKSYHDGMSFLAGREGKSVMGENISIYDDGLNQEGIPMSFDFEGSPKKKAFLVKRGRAKSPVYDSLYASLAGRETTGHAIPPEHGERALPLNLFMDAGDSSEEEILGSLERGILVTKFHYINGLLEPKSALMTGLTRDGTFWVENGKIKHGVRNLRFTQSILEAFSNILKISKTRRPVKVWWSAIGANTVPTILIKDFAFTGKQEKT